MIEEAQLHLFKHRSHLTEHQLEAVQEETCEELGFRMQQIHQGEMARPLQHCLIGGLAILTQTGHVKFSLILSINVDTHTSS
jgi:hypothetical protein